MRWVLIYSLLHTPTGHQDIVVVPVASQGDCILVGENISRMPRDHLQNHEQMNVLYKCVYLGQLTEEKPYDQ